MQSAIRSGFAQASEKQMESQSPLALEAGLLMAPRWGSVMAFQQVVLVFHSVSTLERLAESVIRSVAASRRSAKAFLRASAWAYLPAPANAQPSAAEFAPQLVRIANPNPPA